MNLDGCYIKTDPNIAPLGIELAFTADDVDAAYAQAVMMGAIPVKEPAAKPWGQVVAYVRDLNGVLVELCSVMS